MNNKDKINIFRKLKDYTPPEAIWEAIEKTLSADEKLNRQLKTLKEYSPGDEVWNAIRPKIKPSGFTIAKQTKWIAAASVAVFLLATTWLLTQQSKKNSNMEAVIENYHSETDDAFTTLEAFCVNQNVVCSEPGFTSLKSEYEALKKEESQIRKNVREFKSESDLLKKLNTIEQKKTDILNQMANLI